MYRFTGAMVWLVVLILAGCEVYQPVSPAQMEADDVMLSTGQHQLAAPAARASFEDVQANLAAINDDLARRGLNIAIHKVEWLAPGTPEHAEGQTVYANDRTKTLPYQWVPGDERRLADGNNLTYTIFEPLAVANGVTPASAILDAGYDAWRNETSCSDLAIVKRDTPAGTFPSAILTFGGFTLDPYVADISEIGFIPGWILNAVLGPGASASILGVTFSFIFVESDGTPTDLDRDGRLDRALAEIWYNDDFTWSDGSAPGIDIQTVAQHEQGHAFGLGHFGRIFVTERNNRLHVSPRALMNAAYLGVYRHFAGTDIASHCELYASWPH